MKTKILIIICAVLLIFGTITAQTNQPPTPNDYNSYKMPVKGYSDSTGVAYYAGRAADTLAFKYHSSAHYVTQYLPWVSPKFSSLTIVMTDTGCVVVTVKSRARGHGLVTARAWSTILADSMINITGSADSLTQEFSLKDLDSDLFDGLDQEFMIIVSHPAWRVSDTQGTARRYVFFNSKD